MTAGGTREPIDSVRFIGNRSSGRMGLALADEARRRGARVTLLAANVTAPTPAGVEVVSTPTAADLEREALARADADVILMVAAVADYRAAEPVAGKRPKDDARLADRAHADDGHRTRARREPACRARFSSRSAPSTEPLGSSASGRCSPTRTSISSSTTTWGAADIGFDSLENEVTLITADGDRLVPRAPKREIAAAVLDEVERLREGR